MLFDSWESVLRILVIGVSAYAALVFILRASGKRTLSKMNAFDFVVTVALGSTLATILLSSDVTLVDGVTALLVLVLLQYGIAALSVRWRWVTRLAKSDARTLVVDGRIDFAAARQERVTQEELLSAVRGAGIGDLSDVAAVVLETDGSFSVISRDRAGARTALGVSTEVKA